MMHKSLRESPNYVEFTIPLHEPLASSYHIRVVSDRWLGCETSVTRGQSNPRRCCPTWTDPVHLVHVPAPLRIVPTWQVPLYLSSLALPSAAPTHTELLPLRPLPKSAVGNPSWEGIWKFSHFNAVQVA